MTTPREIRVVRRTHYGCEHLYVQGEAAPLIEQLTGRKTVTLNDIEVLRALGHYVVFPVEAFP